jgi:hypothetical protein
MNRCSKCGKFYEESLLIGGGSIKVIKCRVCPVNHIFMICEHCANLEDVKRSPCPWCGARDMWEVQGMDVRS